MRRRQPTDDPKADSTDDETPGAATVPTFSRALIAALLAAVLATGTLYAQVKVSDLRIGSSDEAADATPKDETATFPASTQRLNVFFDYRGAARQKIGVEVSAPGGLTVFESSQAYSGEGTARIEVGGVDMFRKLADELVGYAQSTETSAKDLGSGRGSYSVYLSTLEYGARLLRDTLGIIDTWDLPSAASSDLEDLQSAVDEIDDLVAQAKKLEQDDKAGREALAALIGDEAGLAATAAEALQAFGEDVTGLAIPETQADRGTAYLVQISVQGSPAMSMEFWVTDAALPEATATEPPPPTRTAEEQATPDRTTVAASRATRSASSAGSATADPGIDLAARTDVESNPTAAARATDVAQRLASEAQVEQTQIAAAPAEVAPGQSSSGSTPLAGDDPASPDALPTWTPVAGGASGGADDEASADGGGGPNLAVLGLGILALAAIALWLRRRV